MPKNLEKDKEEFFRYTLKWATTIELLLENHMSELLSLAKYADDIEEFKKVWKEATFCKDCIVDHCKELLGYASECLTAGCPALESWRELFNVADELHDFILPLNKMEDYTSEVFDKIAEYDRRLREIRKELEEAGMEIVGRDDEEHITAP